MMPDEPRTTRRQRELMAHAIGAEDRRRDALRRRGRKRGPDEFRNYYCASVGGEAARTIEELVGMGLMTIGPKINDGNEFYAYVTEAGIKEVMT